MAKKLILAVIDGLGPALLDEAIAAGRAPTLARLQEVGERTDACASTFPSLTPVCLSTLITGMHPAGTRIPSMTWYHRGEGRFVEYGSSFSATLVEGSHAAVNDSVMNLNHLHLSHAETTLFEMVEDAGLVAAGGDGGQAHGRQRRERRGAGRMERPALHQRGHGRGPSLGQRLLEQRQPKPVDDAEDELHRSTRRPANFWSRLRRTRTASQIAAAPMR